METLVTPVGSLSRATFSSRRAHFCRLALRAAALLAVGPLGSLAAQFAPPASYFGGPGTFPVSLAFGSLRAAANPDLVSANAWAITPPSYYERWENLGGSCPLFGTAPFPAFVPTSTLAPPPMDQGAIDIAIAEIDATPMHEVVTLEPVAFASGYNLRVWSGVAPFTLWNPAVIPTAPSPMQMLVRDFNGDGANDVLVLDSTGFVFAYKNVAGTLVAEPPIPLAPGTGSAIRFAAGSFDGDHLPDLVVLWSGLGALPAQADVLLNTTTAGGLMTFGPPHIVTFPPATTWIGGPGGAGVATDDLDGDGVDDFVVGGGATAGGNGTIWRGTIPRTIGWPVLGALAPAVPLFTLAGGAKPGAIATGDFDLDGDIDVAVAAGDATLQVWPNDGSGGFPGLGQLAPQVLPGWGGVDLETCDIDADGDLDLGSVDGATTQVYCNQADTGRCVHVLRAGIDDSYGVLPLVERTIPRPKVTPAPRGFDSGNLAGPNRLAHTFAGLPTGALGHVVSGKLWLRLREEVAGANLLGFDRLRLDFGQPESGTPIWNAWACNVPVPQASTLLCLDLADLPGGLNLLPRLEQAGRLDVAVDSRTEVDFLRLELITACVDHELKLRYDPLLGVDSYYHDPLVATVPATFSIDASASHAGGIAFLLLGPGIGGFPFESLCLSGLQPIILAYALDGSGRASATYTVGAWPGVLHTQVVAFDTTFAWANAKWSETISDYVH